MVSEMGSISYLKKIPGTEKEEIFRECSVTAYWFVRSDFPEVWDW